MNNKIWNSFLYLQKIAYKEGALVQNDIEDYVIDRYKNLFSSYFPLEEIKNGLVLGPGGSAELKLLQSIFELENLSGITVFKDEATFLCNKGYNVSIGDLHTLPHSTGSQNFIFASNVFEHSLSPYIALMESRRVLSSFSGYMYIVLPDFSGAEGGIGPYHLYCLDDNVWCELLNKTGFSLLHKESINGDIVPETIYHTYLVKTKNLIEPHYSVFKNIIKLRGKNNG